MNNTILLWMLVVAAAAWLYPCFKTFQTGNEKIFHTPLEVTVIAAFVLIEVLMNQSGALLSRTKGVSGFLRLDGVARNICSHILDRSEPRRVIPLGNKRILETADHGRTPLEENQNDREQRRRYCKIPWKKI